MTFVWPWMLLLLLAVPAAGVVGTAGCCGPGPRGARSSPSWAWSPRPTAPAGAALAARAAARRAGAAAGGAGAARGAVPEPRREGTVILAFDISASMAATDLAAHPDGRGEGAGQGVRGAAAADRPDRRWWRSAAAGWSPRRPARTAAAVLAAIDRLTPHGGTALGGGLQTALTRHRRRARPDRTRPARRGSSSRARTSATTARRRSCCCPTGRTPAEPDPLDARRRRLQRRACGSIRSGSGSPGGTVLEIDGFQIATALDEPSVAGDRGPRPTAGTSPPPIAQALAARVRRDRPGVDGARPARSR